jgi:hypothetical protein
MPDYLDANQTKISEGDVLCSTSSEGFRCKVDKIEEERILVHWGARFQHVGILESSADWVVVPKGELS